MRKLDILANEKFNGNIDNAIEYIIRECNSKEIAEYVDEMTPTEAVSAYNVLQGDVFAGKTKDQAAEEVQDFARLESLHLTKEEVMNAKVNPYKAKIGKQFLTLMIMEAGIGALFAVAPSFGISPDVLGIAASTVTTFMATSIGPNLVKFIKFNKCKKKYSSEQYLNETGELSQDKGRGI